MKSRAILETASEGETLLITARYWTPEWVRFIEAIWWPLTLAFWVLFSFSAWFWLATAGFVQSGNETVFYGAVASVVAFTLAWAICRIGAGLGGGYGLAPRGSARLTVELSRKRIAWRGKGEGAIDREGWQVRFVPRPHRLGRQEERDFIRGSNDQAISFAYRDAWEIWLQAGERFFALACISNEADADAIVRRLQAVDLEVTRPRAGENRRRA